MNKKRIGKILLGVVGVAAVVAGVFAYYKLEEEYRLSELEDWDEDCEYEDEEEMDEEILAEEEQQKVDSEEVALEETEESSNEELS